MIIATSCIATACTMLLWIAAAVVFLIIGMLHWVCIEYGSCHHLWLLYDTAGIRYGDECDNLESNISLYLIVQGILSLVYAVTCGFGCCFLANFRKISSWIVFTIAIINTGLTMLSLVWTVIGSIWVWNNWEDWDDNNKLCTDEIYITAMASVLVSCTFWLFIFCFAAFQVLWSYCDKNNSDI